MKSVNQLLAEENLRHTLKLRGYTDGAVYRMIAVLNRSDARIREELAEAIGRLDPSSFTLQRLDKVLASVRKLSESAYAALNKEMRAEIKDFSAYEADYQHSMLLAHTPVEVNIAAVSAEAVYTAALARPFQGRFLDEVLKNTDEAAARRIRQAIAQGFVEGKTTDAIIRQIVGTRAAKYSDGLMQVARREVAAITQTALAHTAAYAADQNIKANLDIVKAVQWSAKLDLETSPACQLRDGKLYKPVDEGDTYKPLGHTIPWCVPKGGCGPGRAHWNCRSVRVPVLKSFKELGLDIPEIKIRNGTRASMDGQVPEDVKYSQWIEKQSAKRQDEALGPNRGRLLREGQLSFDDLYSARGKKFTLGELRERDAEAFKRAGL